MHVKILTGYNEKSIEYEINRLLNEFYNISPYERNFTNVKDIKFTQHENSFSAMIIFD